MALLMGSAMGIVMLGFMWSMHGNVRVNVAIIAGCVLLAGTALYLSRSQRFVDDREYLKGMIPHHSIAILTSEHADIDDIRACQLANGIIESQRVEIDEMSWLIQDIADVLTSHSEIGTVHVVGHTDSTGDDAHNLDLSAARAEAVANALREHGVTATIDARGAGETEPLCTEETEACFAQNRRVELMVESAH